MRSRRPSPPARPLGAGSEPVGEGTSARIREVWLTGEGLTEIRSTTREDADRG